MKSILTVVMSFAMVMLFGTSQVWAQDKGKDAKAAAGQATKTVFIDNEKFLAYETQYKPGDENSEVGAGHRMVRAIQGGTMLRTHPDGKTEKIEINTGRVAYNTPPKEGSPQYTNKNIGNTEIIQYVVMQKDATPSAGAKK